MKIRIVLAISGLCAIPLLARCAPPVTYADLARSRQDLANQFEVNRQSEIQQATDQLNRGVITEAEYGETVRRINEEWGPEAAQYDIEESHRLTTMSITPVQAAAPTYQPTYTNSYSASSNNHSPPPPPPSATPLIGNPCQYMSCPAPASPPTHYIPVTPGDPLNAGLDANGNPTQ